LAFAATKYLLFHGLYGSEASAMARNRLSGMPVDISINADRDVFFGDLHLHTAYSADAAAAGTNLLPPDAYRFAMGEEVKYLGRIVKRRAPLDFLAVTDHAEYLGNVKMVMDGELAPPSSDWLPLVRHQGGEGMFKLLNLAVAGVMGRSTTSLSDPARVHDNWARMISYAEAYNRPGKFTTFVAFEYSPTFSTDGAHLHRNVIFRGPQYPPMPFAATDSMNPEALWAYAEANRKRGIDSLMIPHNPNLSNGRMFSLKGEGNKVKSAEYAQLQARNEPLYEITQNKGSSETTPRLSPKDQFARFEVLDANPETQNGSYLRPGLLRGLELSEKIGLNPFEVGFVGASDFHSGISSSEEDNFPGALGFVDDQSKPVELLTTISPQLDGPQANLSASGITGVWAESNTREAIFGALRRREVFATSGPRIRVRFFAGWGKAAGIRNRAEWVAEAYKWGVPMGGTLRMPPRKVRGPSFVISAVKDPLSGNLDRIQIVKLWRRDGKGAEKIYDVVWSAGRKIDRRGNLEPVGNTVDAASATYQNSIGAPSLFGTWTDPDFNPSENAIYYARVIEIPTPRWSTYLSVRSGVPLTSATPAWLQERAWTSPVFYVPSRTYAN
jgi:hypothetical protein